MHLILLALLLPSSMAAAPIARVLDEDPPLPGEPLVGWEVLEPVAPVSVLGLDQAVELALWNHPAIRAMEAEVAHARGTLQDARSVPNPTWHVDVFAVAAEHTTRLPANFELEVEVSDILHAKLAGMAAKPEVEAARLRLEETRLRLAYETKAAYFDHQAALAAWSAALRSVDAFAAGRDAQRAITGAGNAPARDLALVEVAYEEARIRAAELELEVVATRETLARLVGQEPGMLPPIGSPSAPVASSDLEGIAVIENLGLRALDASIRSARRSGTAANVESIVPDVGVFFESERRQGGWEATAGIDLTIPFLSFGRGEVLRARSTADRLAAERAQLEIDVRSAVRETTARLASARRRARHYEEVVVPARERVLQETLLQYNAMQLGLDPLLDAWRARVESEAAFADTRREALTAQAALDALVAGAVVDSARPARSTSTTTAASGGH